MPTTLSPQTFGFIRRAQVMTGAWIDDDPIRALAATWTCLLSIPREQNHQDRCAISLVVLRTARHMGSPGAFARGQQGAHCVARDRTRVALLFLLHHHRTSNVTLGHLAAHLKISRCHLSRSLGEHSGFNLCTHVSGLRVLDAAVALAENAAPVKWIAYDCGFCGTGEMDHQFHLWYRMTPTEFRRTADVMSLRHGPS